MPKIKSSQPKDLIQLMTAAKEMGATSFKYKGLEVEFALPAPPVMDLSKIQLPPELKFPTNEEIQATTLAMAQADMTSLGFAPTLKRKKPENLTEALKQINEDSVDIIDQGLFMDRVDYANFGPNKGE